MVVISLRAISFLTAPAEFNAALVSKTTLFTSIFQGISILVLELITAFSTSSPVSPSLLDAANNKASSSTVPSALTSIILLLMASIASSAVANFCGFLLAFILAFNLFKAGDTFLPTIGAAVLPAATNAGVSTAAPTP